MDGLTDDDIGSEVDSGRVVDVSSTADVRMTGEASRGREEFAAYRVRLFAAAYRMLGSACGAQDAVRDAVAALATAERGGGMVGDPYAWLVREVFGAVLNRVETARGRREAHAGPWLPEPVLTAGGVLGPLETVESRESVSMARLVLLERLSPVERAAYLLRESFGYGPAETAAVLGLAEARCRSLRRRGQQLVREAALPGEESAERRRQLMAEMVQAAEDEDQAALEEMLTEDVVAWSVGGGEPGVVRRPILGAVKVARFLAGLPAKALEGTRGTVAEVNGDVAVVATAGADVVGVLAPEFGAQGVVGIRTVADPDRLVFLRRQWAERARG